MATPQAPVDPDVKLPPSVAAQAAAADAIHKQAYSQQDAPQPVPVPPTGDVPALQPEPQPAPPPAQSTAPAAPDKSANLTPEQWRHQYLSMKGRYEQAAQSIGTMQEQMSELGDELMRTQQVVRQPVQPVRQNAPTPPPPLLTDEEVRTYGPELIDVIQRAARQAVMPDMQNLNTGVQRVAQRVQQVSTGNLYADLDRAVPDWRAINVSARFKQWCSSRDVYSRQLRGKLLNDAFQAADAPTVAAFFTGFLTEEQATGQLPDPSLQPPVLPVPRQAAVSLESLTAPGRAHPAGGDQPSPVDKPVFTRAQIAAFYADVRRGSYAGREPEKSALEQAIFSAQRDGRIR